MMYWYIAVVLSFLLGVLITADITQEELDIGYKAIPLIEDCQSTLPRDVECVIIAVDEREIGKTEE